MTAAKIGVFFVTGNYFLFLLFGNSSIFRNFAPLKVRFHKIRI